jgi:cyclase
MSPARSKPPKSPYFRLAEAGDGIWAATAADFVAAVGNSAVVDLGGRWLVADTFISARAATDLRAAVEAMAGDEPVWVVNTHSHTDHVGGNEVFAAVASIAATDATRRRVLESAAGLPERVRAAEAAAADAPRGDDPESLRLRREAEARLESLRRLHIVAPDATIGDRLTLHGERRRAELIALAPAHTPGDLAMDLPDDHVILTGDVVVNRTVPYVQDGNVESWLGVLARLRTLRPATVLPGHGQVGDAATIDSMEAMLSALLAAGLETMSEPGSAAPAIPARFADWGGAARWPDVVRQVVAQLSAATREDK